MPALSKKGTPSHRALLINIAAAAKVGQSEPFGTVSSSRYPGSAGLPGAAARPLYCPTTTSSIDTGRIDRSTLTFSSRMSSASSDAGGSIAKSAKIWRRWFWITSRMMP